MAREKLAAFVDYENLRQAFKDYVEPANVEDVIRAFEVLGEELGELRSMQFYGDWTRRPQDAHAIEERGWRTVNVLSTRYGKDRSDIPIAFDMYDTAEGEERRHRHYPRLRRLRLQGSDTARQRVRQARVCSVLRRIRI